MPGVDANGVDALFAIDASYTDRALRTVILGKQAIGKYLARVLAVAPYGKGAKLRHVVSSDQGGGYEWTIDAASVKRGIVAIDLDHTGLIERLSTTWDNAVMSDGAQGARAAIGGEVALYRGVLGDGMTRNGVVSS